eukprot:s316_g24.t1
MASVHDSPFWGEIGDITSSLTLAPMSQSKGLHQKDLTVELLEDRGHATPGMSTSGGDRPRVKWKADSELWEVIVFSPEESVACLGQRINNRDFQPLAAAYSTQPSSSLAAAPFRSPTSNILVSTPSLASAVTIDGFSLNVETTKSGNVWAYVVSEANAALVTVATAKSGQMWAYGALSCRKLGQAITGGTATVLSFSGCAMPKSQGWMAVMHLIFAQDLASTSVPKSLVEKLEGPERHQEGPTNRPILIFDMNLFKVLPLLLSLVAVRCQDDDVPDFDELITEMDGNKDGKVSWDEMFGGEGSDDMDEWPEDIKKQYKAVFKGYEPKLPHRSTCVTPGCCAMRSSSAPPKSSDAAGVGVVQDGNPFWSEKAKMDYLLRTSRPQGLPEQSPGSEDCPPVMDAAYLGQCVGKGRGQSSTRQMFVTPPSNKASGLGHGADAAVFRGKQTEGKVPVDVAGNGKLDRRDASSWC